MAFIIGLLTFVMIVVCLMLILLVLMQLPKKDAGAGLAFGAGATDALFGAGSGNFLTKATKYSAVSFFVLAVVLGILENHYSASYRNAAKFREQLQQQQQSQPLLTPNTTPPPAAPASMPAVAPATNLLLSVPASELAPAASNAVPASAPQK